MSQKGRDLDASKVKAQPPKGWDYTKALKQVQDAINPTSQHVEPVLIKQQEVTALRKAREKTASKLEEEIARLTTSLKQHKTAVIKAETERRAFQSRLSLIDRITRAKQGRRLAPLALADASNLGGYPARPVRPSYFIELHDGDHQDFYSTSRALILQNGESRRTEAERLQSAIKDAIGIFTVLQDVTTDQTTLSSTSFLPDAALLAERGLLTDHYDSTLFLVAYLGDDAASVISQREQPKAVLQAYVDAICNFYMQAGLGLHLVLIIDTLTQNVAIPDFGNFKEWTWLSQQHLPASLSVPYADQGTLVAATITSFEEWNNETELAGKALMKRPDEIFQKLTAKLHIESLTNKSGSATPFKVLCPMVPVRAYNKDTAFHRLVGPVTKADRGEYDHVHVAHLQFQTSFEHPSKMIMQELRQKLLCNYSTVPYGFRTFSRVALEKAYQRIPKWQDEARSRERDRLQQVSEIDFLQRWHQFEIPRATKTSSPNCTPHTATKTSDDIDASRSSSSGQEIQGGEESMKAPGDMTDFVMNNFFHGFLRDRDPNKSHLTIIYFNGHGGYYNEHFTVGNDDDSASMEFNYIREFVEDNTPGDILYVIDSCSSGGANTVAVEPRAAHFAKGDEPSTASDYGRRTELLAACGRSETTIGSGSWMFFKRFAVQLQEALTRAGPPLTVTELHSRISQDFTTLTGAAEGKTTENRGYDMRDPFYADLSIGAARSSIRLLPCYASLRGRLDRWYGDEPLRADYEIMVVVLRHVRHEIADLKRDCYPIICYKGRTAKHIRDHYPLRKDQDRTKLVLKNGARFLDDEDVLGDLQYDPPYVILEAFYDNARTYCKISADAHQGVNCQGNAYSPLLSPTDDEPFVKDGFFKWLFFPYLLMAPGHLTEDLIYLLTVTASLAALVVDLMWSHRAAAAKHGEISAWCAEIGGCPASVTQQPTKLSVVLLRQIALLLTLVSAVVWFLWEKQCDEVDCKACHGRWPLTHVGWWHYLVLHCWLDGNAKDEKGDEDAATEKGPEGHGLSGNDGDSDAVDGGEEPSGDDAAHNEPDIAGDDEGRSPV